MATLATVPNNVWYSKIVEPLAQLVGCPQPTGVTRRRWPTVIGLGNMCLLDAQPNTIRLLWGAPQC
jgi:hypothetical protein